MEAFFSFPASRLAVAISVIFLITNHGLASATITMEHGKTQSSLQAKAKEDPASEMRNIISNIFSGDDDDGPNDVLTVASPTSLPQKKSEQPKPEKPKQEKPKKELPKLELPKSNRTKTTISNEPPEPMTTVAVARRTNHNFDFDISAGVLIMTIGLVLCLYLTQWLVSVLIPIKSPNPVAWLRDTASDVAHGSVPGIIASSARPSRDAKFKLWQNSLSTLMVQAFVIMPFALLAMAVGHYADGENGLDVDLSTFMIAFGACTVLALFFFFFMTAGLICVSCCKIGTWEHSEMLSLTPDEVVRGYSYAIAEQQLNPPKCFEICKQENIQVAIDRMHFLVLRAQVVPFKDAEFEARGNAWVQPFFPSKHEVKDRAAHFDLAQYLTVKLGFVISDVFFIKHWMWLIVGPILLVTMGLQWALYEYRISDKWTAGFEYLEFVVYSIFLLIVVLIIHLKLNCIKRNRFERGLSDVNNKIKELIVSEYGNKMEKEDILNWMVSKDDIMKTFINASYGAQSLPEGREERVWFGDPGRTCGHSWLKHLLQLTLLFSSLLMSIFFWHIVPLLLVKGGNAVTALAIIFVLSAWLSLVIWVPNVVFNLVLLAHCGTNSFDPTVIAKIETQGRARLETGAETIFECIFLHQLGMQRNLTAISEEPGTQALFGAATRRFHAMAVDGYVDTTTLANWFNTNLVQAPITFSQDFISDKLGLASDSRVDQNHFAILYVKATQMRQTLWLDFTKFHNAATQVLLEKYSNKAGTVSAERFYGLINNSIRVPEGYTNLTTMQRVANENAFLAVAEVFDVADVNTVGECDANLLIMVVKMYLSDL